MTQQEFSKRYVYDASTDELGGGGFAHVYKAWDNEEECFVALKIQPVDSRYPDLRLKNEVDRAASLRHPNVARYKACYTFSTFDGNKDIAVMSYYEHGSLDKLLCSQRLTDAEREDILKQILAGVDYLHSQGIIHRDLKPQNILVLHHGGRYVPKITDFGISKQLANGESSAVSNSILGGTYSYASPEQLKETTIRKNTDLWSFGVIVYQMLTGALPFNCGTFSPTSQEGRQEQFRQMTSGVLPEALNNIPEPWQTLIRECLVVDNTQRLTHVEDCMAILNNQPDDVTVDESTIVETPVEVEVVAEPVKEEEVKPRIDTPKQKEQPKSNIPTEPAPKNSKWWLWLLLLLIAVGGAVGYMMSGGDNPEPEPTPAPEPKEKAVRTYAVGNYYNENGKRGVVFQVWDGGRHGKIISLDETYANWDSRLEWDSDTWEYVEDTGTRTYADSESDGKANTDKIMARSDSQYFDAFKWCRAKGSSWYLPALDELVQIHNNKDKLNSTLSQYGTALRDDCYWSSTEYVDYKPEFCAWLVYMYNAPTHGSNKDDYYYVRAVSAF